MRQLDAIAWRFLVNLAGLTGGGTGAANEAGDDTAVDTDAGGYVFVDVNDTIIEVHGHRKQGTGFGCSKVRGINALLATVTTAASAPIIIAQRLRRGACGSPRGGARLISDVLATLRRLPGMGTVRVLWRADSVYYVHAALAGGAAVSVTARMSPRIREAIAAISEESRWGKIPTASVRRRITRFNRSFGLFDQICR